MISREDIERLTEIEDQNCISIYIPTHRAGHNQEDRLRYKNALQEATRQLQDRGLHSNDIEKLLKSAWGLYEDADFWLHQSDGLSLFIADGHFEYFEIPFDFNPFTWVGSQFILRPLLPVFSTDRIFYLLALSKKDVRFFECSRWAITPMKIHDVAPKNMEATAAFVNVLDKLQLHSGQGAGLPPIYHGHDEGSSIETAALREFVSAIEAGLHEALCEHPQPLVLAGVERITSLYKDLSANEGITEATVSGNPDDDDPVLLHEKAVAALGTDFFLDNQVKYAEQFEAYLANERASAALTEIVPETVNGRVAALFTNRDYHTWGQFDYQKHQAIIHKQQLEDSIELLDFAAKQAFLQGAEIFNIEQAELPFPTANINAVYRY